MPKTLQLLCIFAILAASSTSLASDATKVILYGDSMLDGCDPCIVFPSNWQIREFAWSGAEVWHQKQCPDEPSLCRNGEDVVLPQGEPPTCLAADGSTDQCLAANSDADAVVLQWGTNDARKWCWEFRTDPLCQPVNMLNMPRLLAAWSSILTAVETSQIACVIVAPPPVWTDTVLPTDDRLPYQTANARLAELRRILGKLAADHGCRLLDLYQAFSDVQETLGEEALFALYRSCPGKGGIQSPIEDDCVHYSTQGRELVGTLLTDAIETAVRLRRAKYLH